jgi:hypothetical protein
MEAGEGTVKLSVEHPANSIVTKSEVQAAVLSLGVTPRFYIVFLF